MTEKACTIDFVVDYFVCLGLICCCCFLVSLVLLAFFSPLVLFGGFVVVGFFYFLFPPCISNLFVCFICLWGFFVCLVRFLFGFLGESCLGFFDYFFLLLLI